MRYGDLIRLAQTKQEYYWLITPVDSYLNSEDVICIYFKNAFSKNRKDRLIFLFRKKLLQIIKESPSADAESTVITCFSYKTLKKIQIVQPWSEYDKNFTLELDFEGESFIFDSEKDSFIPETGSPHAWQSNYSTELKEIYKFLSDLEM